MIFSNVLRYAKPARRTRMFSCRPRYLIWCRIALVSYSVGLLFWLGLMVRMYDGWERMSLSKSAFADALILSLNVGGRFLDDGSGRSGKRPCRKLLPLEAIRSSRSFWSASLFLSVMPLTVYMTSPA